VDYRAYDSEGRRLELVADPPVAPRRLLGPIWTDNAHNSTLLVRATEDLPTHADDMAELLRKWLPMVGVPLAGPEGLALDELLLKAIERNGYL
jgi:hypothetical protein